jgi:hypothetical protein
LQLARSTPIAIENERPRGMRSRKTRPSLAAHPPTEYAHDAARAGRCPGGITAINVCIYCLLFARATNRNCLRRSTYTAPSAPKTRHAPPGP